MKITHQTTSTILRHVSLLLLWLSQYPMSAQQQPSDSIVSKPLVFSGSLALSSNGFSIVPTFSLNSPAVMIWLSWKKEKFSIDPDIRLTPNVKKGSMIFWFRYHAVKSNKYSLRIGVHPALNFQIREIHEGGTPTSISQMRRFLAWEVANNFNLGKNWQTGIYYLQANGLQNDGARTSHYLALNLAVNKIKLGPKLRLSVAPSIYYLYLDKAHGEYFSGVVALSHTAWPFSIQHAFNKTIRSNIPGNKDYIWNVSVHYNFRIGYMRE